MTNAPQCGWTLQLIAKGRKTPTDVTCTEDQGHADTMHSDGETSWAQLPHPPTPEPDTEIELT